MRRYWKWQDRKGYKWIPFIIKKRQLGFVGQITRESGLERLCLGGKFEGRRARGRQRLTYLVSLAEKVGLKTHQLIHCAGDRRAFRALAAKASI